MTRALSVCVLSVLAGCTETIQLTNDPFASLVALEVTPADSTVMLTSLAEPHHTLQFAAMGRFSDGSTRDLTTLVEWSSGNALLGQIDARGLFTASHTTAGYGAVTAKARGLTASGALTIIIDATLVDATFPPPAADLFSPTNPIVTGDPTNAPALLEETGRLARVDREGFFRPGGVAERAACAAYTSTPPRAHPSCLAGTNHDAPCRSGST